MRLWTAFRRVLNQKRHLNVAAFRGLKIVADSTMIRPRIRRASESLLRNFIAHPLAQRIHLAQFSRRPRALVETRVGFPGHPCACTFNSGGGSRPPEKCKAQRWSAHLEIDIQVACQLALGNSRHKTLKQIEGIGPRQQFTLLYSQQLE